MATSRSKWDDAEVDEAEVTYPAADEGFPVFVKRAIGRIGPGSRGHTAMEAAFLLIAGENSEGDFDFTLPQAMTDDRIEKRVQVSVTFPPAD